MIPERSIEVLRAIVQDYIETREPVGSKALVERHGFGVSAATIRNDMALLEEEQLIVAPHTSSGRVPTDKGYRLFVDRLNQVKPLSPAERNAIETFLTDSADLDETLTRTVRLLSQLTSQMAVVQYPTLGRAVVKSLELVPVSESKVLIILITDASRIQQHVVDLGTELDAETLAELRAKLLTALLGQPLSEVAQKLNNFELEFAPNRRLIVTELMTNLFDLVDANRQNKILVAGAANLARRENDFGGNISTVLEAIEQQVVLLKLISELTEDAHGVSVRIGKENQLDPFGNAAVLVSGYENQGSEIAKLGVIGPTRMDYSSNIAAVRAVASYLTKMLG
ncbi:MAG: heat-inducible transcriptional repressor HrcA [Micrococcales bacterium]